MPPYKLLMSTVVNADDHSTVAAPPVCRCVGVCVCVCVCVAPVNGVTGVWANRAAVS